MPGSTINITSADVSTSTKTLLARITFQSKQKKNKLLGAYKNLEIEMPNIRTPPNQRNQNPELIHQQNLPPVIIIDQPPIEPIGKPIQPPPVLPQQLLSLQQPLQQPSQPPNLDPMAYALITKLDNFISKEDDTQVWLNNVEKAIAANGWNDAQAMQAISYFFKDTTNS
ncbi:hypothetical protein G9A89_015809 [Geosiphon pyriformis]|nr:hypothetical protein G9A89_015809 [Geosiphon pyriformis]